VGFDVLVEFANGFGELGYGKAAGCFERGALLCTGEYFADVFVFGETYALDAA
jgi:hypothetical protein